MKPNKVKKTLREGGVSVGTMVFEFSSSGIGRIVAEADADFVLFDMEHTAWSIETIRDLLATSQVRDLVPLVRVPVSEYHFLARVMEAGAMGVMVPMVHDADEARRVVAAVKYPPEGRRGAAFGVAHDGYSGGDIVAKMRVANEEGLVIVQIESRAGLDNVEAIAAVEGVDVLWIGQSDLSSALGIPGDFAHADFQAAVERVVQAAEKEGKAAAFMALSIEEARAFKARGFRCLAYSGDLWIYQNALRAGMAAIREG